MVTDHESEELKTFAFRNLRLQVHQTVQSNPRAPSTTNTCAHTYYLVNYQIPTNSSFEI